MMKFTATLLLALTLVAMPASAHHGVAWYDYSKTVTAEKATVTLYDWANPHTKIYFDVLDDRHQVQHWMAEMHPPEALIEHGWTRQTLHPGDVISISFRPAKDGTKTALVEEVTLPNGLKLRQNVLLVDPGKIMTIQEWSKYVRDRAAAPHKD